MNSLQMMKRELTDYDIFPKVFCADTAVTVRIVPLGKHAAFDITKEYTLHVRPLSEGNPRVYENRPNIFTYHLTPERDGGFTFVHVFAGEQEHFIRVLGADGKRLLQLSVYSIGDDLVGRYPYMGDLHMHTCRSDGTEAPDIVAANYRKYGYDFLAITDHHRYYPSLEAMNAFKDVPLDYTLIPGEEVHLPGNDVHIVNFGSTYSVAALLKSGPQNVERGEHAKYRSLDGVCPPTISEEAYRAEVNARLATLDLPQDFPDPFAYAACEWICDQIRKANGLAIFCHPYWISDVYQVPETFVELLMERQPFDAFEVCGGLAYYEQNGFQYARYYQDREKGRKYPVVGSTDSHGSVHNPHKLTARTIVFATENKRETLISSIKDFYSVAVDMVGEAKFIGEFRLVKYACFLMRNYFPLHDELCYEEGRAMKDYVCGDPNAKKILETLSGRTEALRMKYFHFKTLKTSPVSQPMSSTGKQTRVSTSDGADGCEQERCAAIGCRFNGHVHGLQRVGDAVHGSTAQSR